MIPTTKSEMPNEQAKLMSGRTSVPANPNAPADSHQRHDQKSNRRYDSARCDERAHATRDNVGMIDD